MMRDSVLQRKKFDKIRAIIPEDKVQLFFEDKCIVLSGDLYRIWLLVDGQRSILDLSIDSGIELIKTAQLIKYLISSNVMEVKL